MRTNILRMTVLVIAGLAADAPAFAQAVSTASIAGTASPS